MDTNLSALNSNNISVDEFLTGIEYFTQTPRSELITALLEQLQITRKKQSNEIEDEDEEGKKIKKKELLDPKHEPGTLTTEVITHHLPVVESYTAEKIMRKPFVAPVNRQFANTSKDVRRSYIQIGELFQIFSYQFPGTSFSNYIEDSYDFLIRESIKVSAEKTQSKKPQSKLFATNKNDNKNDNDSDDSSANTEKKEKEKLLKVETLAKFFLMIENPLIEEHNKLVKEREQMIASIKNKIDKMRKVGEPDQEIQKYQIKLTQLSKNTNLIKKKLLLDIEATERVIKLALRNIKYGKSSELTPRNTDVTSREYDYITQEEWRYLFIEFETMDFEKIGHPNLHIRSQN